MNDARDVSDWRCRIGWHRWGAPRRVTVPLFDMGARGLLWRCIRAGCEGVKAR